MDFAIIPNLHPLAVHFPIALTAVSFLFFAGARIGSSRSWAPQWSAVGHWTLWLAALSSVGTAGLGWLAFNSVKHDDVSHVAMLLHRNWALPTAIGLVVVAAWDLWRIRETYLPSVSTVLATGLLFVAVSVSGWLGGELVYRHGLGVLSLPHGDAEADRNNSDTHTPEGNTATIPPASTPLTAPTNEPAEPTKHHHEHSHRHDHP
jgi:uncharacterized membrane protein